MQIKQGNHLSGTPIFLCDVWSQNFESIDTSEIGGGKFLPSCYNLEDNVERNLIRMMRITREESFGGNYKIVIARVCAYTGWIAVKKESQLDLNL